MKENESPQEYFLRMLEEGKISFVELSTIYVEYLQNLKRKQRSLLVDGSVIVASSLDKRLWGGTKKELQEKSKKFLKEADVFVVE